MLFLLLVKWCQINTSTSYKDFSFDKFSCHPWATINTEFSRWKRFSEQAQAASPEEWQLPKLSSSSAFAKSIQQTVRINLVLSLLKTVEKKHTRKKEAKRKDEKLKCTRLKDINIWDNSFFEVNRKANELQYKRHPWFLYPEDREEKMNYMGFLFLTPGNESSFVFVC